MDDEDDHMFNIFNVFIIEREKLGERSDRPENFSRWGRERQRERERESVWVCESGQWRKRESYLHRKRN